MFQFLIDKLAGMGHRRIYSNAPLALTVVELRHTLTPPLNEEEQAALKKLLSDVFPIARPLESAAVNIPLNAVGQATTKLTIDPRYMTRDSTTAVTFRADGIVVETTAYKRRSDLRELLRRAVEARLAVSAPDGMNRLGLRYINEIRADVDTPGDWSKWISPALTGMAELHVGDTSRTQAWQGMATFGDQHCGVVLRHGNLDGYAVAPDGDLRRVTDPPGPFYLLDLDSYWTPDPDIPTLDWWNIEQRYDEAALSAYGLFEQLITDTYREEVLREHHEQ
ncbi:TIGR04255 family protein [Streptomyces griseoluteus]|uniref:TIGR04255 family protein n=1 Tax=Streptomyces griseoluteus TaxID=29306 RepID=UPI003814FC55